MKRLFFILLLLECAFPGTGRCAGQFLVETSQPEKIQALTDQAGLELVHRYRNFPWALYRAKSGGTAALKPASLAPLFAKSSIKIERDTTVTLAGDPLPKDPNDTDYADQVQFASPLPDADIKLREAWALQTDSPDVTVAIVDTGIDSNTPDLSGSLWTNAGEFGKLGGVDDDHNGFIDDDIGWNFVDNNNDITDTIGHGTQVAGIFGALGNNNFGIAGVCWRPKIMVIKALSDNGQSNVSTSLEGLDYAMDFPEVKIINASWGTYDSSSAGALNAAVQAMKAKGILLVAAAGNGVFNGTSLVGVNLAVQPFYPAAFHDDNVISVASVDTTGTLSTFSNYGLKVTLAVPGENLLTTTLNGQITSVSGTSFAAPVVTGAAALLLGLHPNLPPDEIKFRMLLTARPTDSLVGTQLQGGLMNVLALLQYTPPTAVDSRVWRSYR